MPADHAAQPWAIRSTLVAVADLGRSVAFYREVGPFEEIARDDEVAILGQTSADSTVLILRQARTSFNIRHGQQSLGLRSITFNVGSFDEVDRIEAVLREHNLFTSRHALHDGASVLLRGRDPDNLPLVFVCYGEGTALGPDFFRTVTNLVYALDA